MRVGIVGAGRMGRERGRAATSLGARVIDVCDTDSERVTELASGLRARALTEPSQMDWHSLDAVFICTPPAARGPAELAAIRAGVPLFVEKPVGVCAEQSLALLQAIRANPVLNAAGYMNRYRESVGRARRLLVNATPLAVAFHWFATRYRAPWWLRREQSGGPLNEQCTHFVDLCRFLIGEIAEVQATARALADAPDLEGAAAMTLRFRNGVLGTGLYSCESAEKQIEFKVFLPDRCVRLQGWDLRLEGDDPAKGEQEDIFVKEVAAFFQAIRSRDQSLIQSDFEDAMKTQVAVDAIGRAARSGRSEPVAISSEASHWNP